MPHLTITLTPPQAALLRHVLTCLMHENQPTLLDDPDMKELQSTHDELTLQLQQYMRKTGM